MKRTRLGLSIVVGVVLVLNAPAWADGPAGVDAYERGDYATALKEFRPLAEQGNTVAQNNLGLMYEKGQGVPQDYQEAARWFRLAAEQGHALAQNNLGVVYGKGQGVKQDYVIAHKWTNLAAANGVKEAVKRRDLLEEELTPSQLAEAQRLAREWTPKEK